METRKGEKNMVENMEKGINNAIKVMLNEFLNFCWLSRDCEERALCEELCRISKKCRSDKALLLGCARRLVLQVFPAGFLGEDKMKKPHHDDSVSHNVFLKLEEEEVEEQKAKAKPPETPLQRLQRGAHILYRKFRDDREEAFMRRKMRKYDKVSFFLVPWEITSPRDRMTVENYDRMFLKNRILRMKRVFFEWISTKKGKEGVFSGLHVMGREAMIYFGRLQRHEHPVDILVCKDEGKGRVFIENRILGKGSFGTVRSGRMVTDELEGELTIPVAIKIFNHQRMALKKVSAPKISSIIKDEIAAMARCIGHPNIIQIYFVMFRKRKTLCGMEYAARGDLAHLLEENGALNEKQCQKCISKNSAFRNLSTTDGSLIH